MTFVSSGGFYYTWTDFQQYIIVCRLSYVSYISHHIACHQNISYSVSRVTTKMKIAFGLHEFLFLSQMLSKEMMSFGILGNYRLCFVPARIARYEWLSCCHFKEKKNGALISFFPTRNPVWLGRELSHYQPSTVERTFF